MQKFARHTHLRKAALMATAFCIERDFQCKPQPQPQMQMQVVADDALGSTTAQPPQPPPATSASTPSAPVHADRVDLVQELRAAFNHIDTHNNGSISTGELKECLRAAGVVGARGY